jgi:broad specificity phosphatase PhoE
MKLYFLRHGQSQANVDGLYSAENDSPLTELGKEQAKAAGHIIRGLGIDVIIASNQQRAADTARIIADAIGLSPEKVETDSRLREVSVGSLIGTPSRGLLGYMEHQADPQGDPEVEMLADVERRLTDLVADLGGRTEGAVLLVGHGNSGLILQSLLSGQKLSVGSFPKIQNAQLVELSFPGKMEVAV